MLAVGRRLFDWREWKWLLFYRIMRRVPAITQSKTTRGPTTSARARSGFLNKSVCFVDTKTRTGVRCACN